MLSAPWIVCLPQFNIGRISQLPTCQWEKSESLEQLRWLYAGYRIHTATTLIETPNIDCPEDVEKVLSLIQG